MQGVRYVWTRRSSPRCVVSLPLDGICTVSFPGNDNPLVSRSISKGIDKIVLAPDEKSIDFDGIGVVPADRGDSKLSKAGRSVEWCKSSE